MTPKVSIVIPNYNHARFLERRIQSVLNQTYQDFEVIYLDDCSNDNSRDIIEKYKNNEKVSKVIINSENSGSTFKQWNKGIKQAKGEYVWLAESDDYADNRFLEFMVPILEENPNVGIVKCRSYVVDQDNNILDILEENYPRDWSKSFILNGKEECLLNIKHGISIANASATLIRKSVYEAIGCADTSFKMAGDWMTWCRMLDKSDFAYISEPLNYMRQVHSNTARAKHLYSFTGTRELEDIKVVSFLIRSTALSFWLERKILQKLVKRWVYFIFTLKGTHMSFKNNIMIFKELYKISPYTLILLIKYILLRPVNAIVRRLFYLLNH